jgi:hypothetical protein
MSQADHDDVAPEADVFWHGYFGSAFVAIPTLVMPAF